MDDALISPEWIENGPAFSEPWQAEAFAVTMQLSRAGCFTWKQWVATFSEEIKCAPQLEGEDTNAAYFRQWMQALQKIMHDTDLLNEDELAEYCEHWRRSYYHTIHGAPIHFRKDLTPIPDGALDALDHHHDHDHCGHDHAHHAGPVAVSKALA